MDIFEQPRGHKASLAEQLRLKLADSRYPIAQRVVQALDTFQESSRGDDDVLNAVVLLRRSADIAHRDSEVKDELAHGVGRQLVHNLLRFMHWRMDEISSEQAFEVLLSMERIGGPFSPQIVQELGQVVREGLHEMSDRMLFVAVRAFDSLGGTDREFYLDTFHKLVPLLPHFEKFEINALTQIFLRHEQSGFAEIGLDVAAARLSSLTDRQLKRCAGVFGDVGFRSEDGSAFAREASARLVHAAEVGKELIEAAAETVIALARQKIQNDDLLRLFADRATDLVSWFSDGQLAWLSWAYYQGRNRHEGLLTRIGNECISRLGKLLGEEVVLVCGALRRFGMPCDPLLVAVSQHYKGRFEELKPKDLADLAYSFALLDEPRGPLNVKALMVHMNSRNPSLRARYRMHIAAVAAGVEEPSSCSRELREYSLSQMREPLHEVADKICQALIWNLKIPAHSLGSSTLMGVIYADLQVTIRGRKLAFFFDYAETPFVGGERVSANARIFDKYVRRAGYEPIRLSPHDLKGLEGASLARYLAGQIGIDPPRGGEDRGSKLKTKW